MFGLHWSVNSSFISLGFGLFLKNHLFLLYVYECLTKYISAHEAMQYPQRLEEAVRSPGLDYDYRQL